MRKIDEPTTVVDIDGTLLIAVGAGSEEDVLIQSDNPEFVAEAKKAATLGTAVEIIHLAKPFNAGWETPLEVAAALFAVCPGRAILLECPVEVAKALQKAAGPSEPGIIY